jgi:hypothetical protein
MSKLIGIDTQLFGLLAPVTELDIAEAVFAGEFSGRA